jgi:hypothetical protein
VRAAYWALPSLALFASMRATARVSDALESVQGERAAIGVQLVPGRARPAAAPPPRADDGCVIERIDALDYRLILRVPGRDLEVSTDANAWTAVPARRIGPDTWEVVLALEPGLYRIAIRVDGGAWRPPPGLPTTSDEFGGEVGLLVVP